MTGCVLDASAAVALLASNQATTASRAFAAALPAKLIAPALFTVEIRNSIVKLERRKMLPVPSADSLLADLESLIELVPTPDPFSCAQLLNLARVEALGMYDILYLDLASSRGASLASREGPLLAAAKRRGVAIIDLR